jgi:pilus assembly protein FimV
MRTAVRRVLLLSALMSPGAIFALGLGEIRLNSALNQPFDADIELVSATQEDLGALRASLASGETFTRYGLDRPAYLSDFTFRVAKGPGGVDVLRVTSPRPVTEPFVTLLVEANWPRGRLLREYTVLLDPPVFAPAQPSTSAAPAVAAPRVSSGGATSTRVQEPVRSEAPVQERQAPRASAPVAARPASIEAGTTYQVRPNDTLWRIASAAHPGSRSDVNRAMVSIYQGNPEAFDGNINVLRAGSTLRIPQADEVAAVSAAVASAEVSRQYEAWRSGRAASASPSVADTGRLRLVTPEQGTTAPSTATTAPAVAPAAPAPVASAPGGLDARVKQLENELAEARRLLEVRNAELATLQGGDVAIEPGTDASTAAAAPVAAEPVTDEAATPPADAEAAPVVAPAAEPAKPAAEPKPAEPAGPTLLERLSEYWWALVALLAVIGGALLFRRLRRERGSAEADLEDALARDLRAQPRSTGAPRARDGGIVVEEKRAGEGQRLTQTAAPVRSPETTRKAVTIDDTLSGDGPASMDSGDPLAEADFHMAYGLYDQAADLVQLALKREPQRRDLRLKLLEIFFVWGNKDRFLQLANEMGASRADAPAGEWDKILIMGKQIAPNDPLFSAAPRSSNEALDLELHGATGTIDMSLFPGESAAPDLDLTATDTARVDSSGIDFILDEPVRGADDEPGAGPTIETPQVHARRVNDDTEELPVERLGLDLDALRGLESLDAPETTVVAQRRKSGSTLDDTDDQLARIDADEQLDVDLDMIGSTALIKMSEDTAHMLRAAADETAVVDLSDATGELPMIDSVELLESELHPSGVDFDLGGEPATMSEVGTKLDLARAYMDMGDPEGARSILDEVLEEGSTAQRQEAERLIASLP